MTVKNHLRRLLVPIIVIAVVIAGALMAWLLTRGGSSVVITRCDGGANAAYCYTAPDPGEYYCFIEVNTARQEYAGEDVLFLLAVDVFDASGNELTGEELDEEYQRLAALGYQLYQTTHVAYIENGEAVRQPVTVGMFTEEQLSDFDADSDNGYVFRFVSNADGSLFSVSQDELIAANVTDIAE